MISDEKAKQDAKDWKEGKRMAAEIQKQINRPRLFKKYDTRMMIIPNKADKDKKCWIYAEVSITYSIREGYKETKNERVRRRFNTGLTSI